VAISPQAKYTDRRNRRSWCRLLRVEDVAWSAQLVRKAVNLDFLDRGVISAINKSEVHDESRIRIVLCQLQNTIIAITLILKITADKNTQNSIVSAHSV
jgi:hypothetical protein